MAIQAQMCPDNLGLPLGGSQDWLMANHHDNSSNPNNTNHLFFNGCGFNEFGFNLQHKQQQQHQQQQQQQQVQIPYQQQQQQYLVQFHNMQQRNHNQNQNQSLPCENGFVFLPSSKNCNNNGSTTSTVTTTTSSDHLPVNLSQRLAAQLEKHMKEIDRYITLQNEKLKVALQQQRKQQLATLLRKLEAKTNILLKQKDEEIAEARNRGTELEECVRKMELENQTWQRVAAEKEAMVVSLNNTLEQLRAQQPQGCYLASSSGVDDAQSCCGDNGYPGNNNINNNDGVIVGHDGREDDDNIKSSSNAMMMMMMMVCRFCNSRNSSMLLLPCRHLCSCKSCEPFVDACPLCKSPKTASIEALFS